MTGDSSASHREIRIAVRALCERFPGAYWRELDRIALLSGGFRSRTDGSWISRGAHSRRIWRQRLAALGGRGNSRRNPCVRRQRGCLSRPDVHDGHDSPSRQHRTEKEIPSRDRRRKAAVTGLRRHRTGQRHRYAKSRDDGNSRAGRITSSTVRKSGLRAPSIRT